MLKKILDEIWIILNSRILYIVIISLLVFFGLKSCNNIGDLKIENQKLNQNISAYSDTIRIYKTKEGEWQAEKSIFIKSEKELKKENSELYKRIEKQDGKIISLNRAVVKLKQDSTILQDSIKYLKSYIDSAVKIDDNTWMLPWELEYHWDSTNYDIFKGKTFVSVYEESPGKYRINHDNTLLYNRDSQIDITFGEKVVDGKFNVYIKTAYPGFTTESMEGVFIDPNTNKDIKRLIKKKHWLQGFSVGLSVTAGVNPFTQKPNLIVGPSLNYNIYSW